MQLKGNRIFLNIPKKEETKLIIDHNTKEDLEKEMFAKMKKLVVHSVGGNILDIKPGDIVLVEASGLRKAEIIPLSDAEDVLMINYYDVIGVW